MRLKIAIAGIAAALAACASPETTAPPPACPDPVNPACNPPPPDEHCASGTVAQADGSCTRPGIDACTSGFTRDASGAGCVEIAPASAADCAPGTRPRIGMESCTPAGWNDCGPGFITDATGFGCRDALPDQACTGASFERLGMITCVPLAGCADTFPPPSATIFVKADYTAAQLDATHFNTVSAAIAAAPPGATIAVFAGTYDETFTLTKAIALIGHCASDTIVRGTGALASGAWIRGARGARIEQLTFTRHDIGVEIDSGADVALAGVAIDDNQSNGILISQASTLHLSASVIRATRSRPDGRSGRGMSIQTGSQVVLEDVDLAGNREIGAYVSGAGTSLSGSGVVVRETIPSASGSGGRGLEAINGGSIALSRVALIANQDVALRLSTPDTHVRLDHFVARDTTTGIGVVVLEQAALELDGAAIDANHGAGLMVTDGGSAQLAHALISRTIRRTPDEAAYGVLAYAASTVRLEDSAVVGVDGRAIISQEAGASVEVVESLIADTAGELAPGLAVVNGGTATLQGSTITNSGASGVLLGSGGGEVSLLETIVERTRASTTPQVGGGVIANAGRLTIEQSAIRNNASIGLVVGPLHDSTTFATVRASAIRDTAGREGLSEDDQEGFGIWVSRGSTLALSATDVSRNEFAGLGAQEGSSVSVDHSVFREMKKNRHGDYGEGIYSETDLTVSDSAIIGCITIGVHLVGDRSYAKIARTLVDATLEKEAQVFGHGVMIVFGGMMELAASEVRGSKGVGVAVDGGSALISGSLIRANAIGIHVQGSAMLSEVETAPEHARPLEVLVTRDTRLEENGTRLGAGMLPVPDAITGPPL